MKAIFYLSFLSLFLLSCSKDSVKKEKTDPQTKVLEKILNQDGEDEELKELVSFADSGNAQDEYNLGAYYLQKSKAFVEKARSCDQDRFMEDVLSGVINFLNRFEKLKQDSKDKTPKEDKTEEAKTKEEKKEAEECFYATEAFSYYQDKSIVWLEKAAYKQYLPAIASLGEQYFKKATYSESEKRQEYLEKAYSHLKDATSRGDRKSHYFLAVMYETGFGTSKDLEKALRHYTHSGLLDAKELKDLKDRIEQEEKTKKEEASDKN